MHSTMWDDANPSASVPAKSRRRRPRWAGLFGDDALAPQTAPVPLQVRSRPASEGPSGWSSEGLSGGGNGEDMDSLLLRQAADRRRSSNRMDGVRSAGGAGGPLPPQQQPQTTSGDDDAGRTSPDWDDSMSSHMQLLHLQEQQRRDLTGAEPANPWLLSTSPSPSHKRGEAAGRAAAGGAAAAGAGRAPRPTSPMVVALSGMASPPPTDQALVAMVSRLVPEVAVRSTGRGGRVEADASMGEYASITLSAGAGGGGGGSGGGSRVASPTSMMAGLHSSVSDNNGNKNDSFRPASPYKMDFAPPYPSAAAAGNAHAHAHAYDEEEDAMMDYDDASLYTGDSRTLGSGVESVGGSLVLHSSMIEDESYDRLHRLDRALGGSTGLAGGPRGGRYSSSSSSFSSSSSASASASMSASASSPALRRVSHQAGSTSPVQAVHDDAHSALRHHDRHYDGGGAGRGTGRAPRRARGGLWCTWRRRKKAAW